MISINLDITQECNLKCLYCGAAGECRTGSKNTNEEEMHTNEIVSILTMAKEAGCRILTIAGGEPLLRRDLPEVLRSASSLGYATGILTNGTLITDEKALELGKAGVAYVRVSMESAHKSRFEEYRGKDTFEKAKQAINNLKKHGIVVGVGSTIYPDNVGEMDGLLDFCLAHQVDFIRFSSGFRIGLAKDQIIGFSHYLSIIDKLQSILVNKFVNRISNFEMIPENIYEHLNCSCPGGRYTYHISPAGKVGMCPLINNVSELERFETQNTGDENHFKALRNSMEQLMENLPNEIKGKCGNCELKYTCRGGCPAVKLHDGLSIYDEQPLCVKEILSELVAKNVMQEGFRKLVAYWLSDLPRFSKRGIPLCIRQLPFWTIDLTQFRQ